MIDAMMFPKTLDEFMEQYKIVDVEQVYTNGAELVPIFRIKQWEDTHEPRKGKWMDTGLYCVCSLCLHTEPPQYDGIQPIPNFPPYCSMCGARMNDK